jgi:hypothetical protein
MLMDKAPLKARVRFPDADGKDEWHEVEVNTGILGFDNGRTMADA